MGHSIWEGSLQEDLCYSRMQKGHDMNEIRGSLAVSSCPDDIVLCYDWEMTGQCTCVEPVSIGPG
ncbi:hypothetical protein E2C01_060454 [Portunus trituberculatus]|uniref:Uncharacterized protein n=1 Tax=Portunus trituberculatus TaxID=210409 RepID=A0A5B7HAJ3_PORTR|nr:hypothetical protein [Portunus trituberculatus]